MLTKSQRKLLFLSSLGGVLEFYDFIIFALLAGYISKVFFPFGSNVTSLLITFATFSLGYLARPIGGILFGHFGDKYGRKKTFAFSIFLMASATFLIGVVPSYQSIGLAAPIILTFLRILQGFSVGGEIPGAIAYVSESMPERKGLANGIIFFSLLSGLTLGSLFQAILASVLSPDAMFSWGFRVLFLIGGLFGFLSYWMRRQLVESPLFSRVAHRIEAFPLASVFRKRFLNAFAGFFIAGMTATSITLLFLFMPVYLNKVLLITTASYIWYNTIAIFLTALGCILFGWMSDHVNHKKLLLILFLIAVIAAYPIFWIYVVHFEWMLAALFICIVIASMAAGIIPSLLSELFPTSIRYSGIAICYNLGFGIFGGLTPLVATYLIYKTDCMESPAFYLIGVALLAGVMLIFVKPQQLDKS